MGLECFFYQVEKNDQIPHVGKKSRRSKEVHRKKGRRQKEG